MEAHALVAANPFVPAREQFENLVARLDGEETRRMTHADVERLLRTDGTELLRRLFQGHLDARGVGEAAGAVVGCDGKARTHARVSDRELVTVFGSVRLARMGYGQRQVKSLYPRDAELNVPPEIYSHGVRRQVAEETARGSFDEAVAAIERTTGADVAKRQTEELAARAATDFDAFYDSRAAATRAEAAKTAGILVLTTDGKGVVMRPESLREATRKAASERQRKLRKRLSKGEKTSTRRMATVASVYTIAPLYRTPEDIVRDLDADKREAVRRPRPEHKRVWASVSKEPAEVIEEMFEEAERRDPKHGKAWVVLVDGNETQLRLIKETAARRGVKVTIQLDVIHVIEYLWRAAYCFSEEGTAEAEGWVTERLLELLRGKSSDVAAGIRRSATLRGLEPGARAAADDCADYLLKYRAHLDYDVALAAGLPIATGVIEGACRYLVKDRMDITGARWGLVGAEAILRLRALRASGDFDSYWTFHEQRELARHHAAKYAGSPPPTIVPVRPTRHRRPHLRLVP
jgi:hypothetical protein